MAILWLEQWKDDSFHLDRAVESACANLRVSFFIVCIFAAEQVAAIFEPKTRQPKTRHGTHLRLLLGAFNPKNRNTSRHPYGLQKGGHNLASWYFILLCD